MNIHSYTITNNYTQLKDRYYLQLLYTLLGYLFIQLNFELTSHSFGSRFTYFFNSNLFFFEAILLSTLLGSIYLIKLFRTKFKFMTMYQLFSSKLFVIKKLSWLWSLLFIMILQVLVFLSFTPLINYFL